MATDPVAAYLAGIEFPRGALLAIFNAFFDESERGDGDQPIAVAGYLFKPVAYKRFCRDWARLLRRTRVPVLHMTDLVSGGRAFKGMPLERRAAVLEQAVTTINAHMLAGAAVLIRQREFEAVVPRGWANVYGSIYTLACQLSFQALAAWMDDHGKAGTVWYHFEQGHKYEHEANAALDLSAAPDMAHATRYHAHSFVPKGTAGNQAADILAWLLTRCISQQRIVGAKARAFFEPVLQLALQDQRYRVLDFSGNVLQDMVRYQLAQGPGRVVSAPHRATRRLR